MNKKTIKVSKVIFPVFGFHIAKTGFHIVKMKFDIVKSDTDTIDENILILFLNFVKLIS